MEIVVGTYEEFLLGYKCIKKESDSDNTFRFHRSFADHAHHASIRCVCAEGIHLASGSADENINVYDMKKRMQTGNISQHHGTINCLALSPKGTHLLSGSDDGTIAIFRTGSWVLQKIFSKAHGGEAVTCLAVHPSGKLALSVGCDATLRTWNLVKGRQAYATNLGKSLTVSGKSVSCLLWSPDGSKYVLTINTNVRVYDVSTAGIIYNIEMKKKAVCLCFTHENEIIVGDERGRLTFYNIAEKKRLSKKKAHDMRVKCLNYVSMNEKQYVVSASSGGQIKLWQYEDSNLEELCNINTDCRITCMAIFKESALNIKIEAENPTENASSDTDIDTDTESKSSSIDEQSSSSSVKNLAEDNADKINGKPKKKKIKITKPAKHSKKSKVVSTIGQKWAVEDA